MEQSGEWPIPIIATQDVACGAKLWSTAGRRRATVVVKATFYLLRGGPMRLVNPAPILLGDQHHEQSVDRSVVAPSDCAPYLPRAEVVFAGHAYAPTPSPFVPIRLAVVGSRPLVDKTLHVYGERMWLEGDQMTAPVPFTRIPIRYERAYRGASGFEENPVGMAKGPGLPVHNVIDPSDPEAPAGLGPIAPYWPPRRRLLRNLDPSAVQAPEPDLPDTFAWSFFHAAPPDQRCSFFEGNEWIVLEGLHPEHPRFESQLPSARARARIYSMDSTSYREVGLAADTLWIDGDRSLCCVLYRGNFEVEDDAMLASTQLFAGLELPGRQIPWPDSGQPAAEVGRGDTTAREASREPTPVSGKRPDMTLHSPAGVVQAGSGSHAAVNPGGLPQGAAIRPASGQYAAVSGTTAAAGPAAGASQSLLAALAKDPVGAAPAGTPLPGNPPGWTQGATLASPGAMAQAVAAMQAGTQPPAAAVAIHEPPQASSDSYVKVDAAWLEEAPAPSTDPTAARPIPSSTMGHTMTQPPSELRNLLQQTHPEEDRGPAVTKRRIDIEDSPTVAPDTGDLARILQEAEQHATENEQGEKKPQQVGARPSPGALRAQKTTIRGLGGSAYTTPKPSEAHDPPPTARVTAENLLQSEESPTAQLPVPEILLKLAAQPASTPSPRVVSAVAPQVDPLAALDALDALDEHAPSSTEDTSSLNEPHESGAPPPTVASPSQAFVSPVIEDDEDTGRPTLSGMEAPPVSALAAPPQVHKGEAKIELERRIREGESLEALDLSDLDLSGFDLSGRKLKGCKFDRSNLRRCRLRGADLSGASLEGADLGETDLEDALLERTNLVSSKLSGASLKRAFLTDANLTTADARRANFDEASGQRTIFARARLDGVSALDAKFDTADFTEAQLDGATFDGALLPELRAYEVSAEDASFARCMLQHARFDGAVVSRARFDGASAEDSMWDRAVLDAASFEGAKLVGASFTKASLRGTTLSHCNLEEARFNRANLTGARFVGVDLGRLTLDGADLTGIVTND